MRIFHYYSRNDSNKEKLGTCVSLSRASAAVSFANRKRLSLKQFLTIFEVSR